MSCASVYARMVTSRKDAQKQLWRQILAVAAGDLAALDEEMLALGPVGDEYYLAGGLHARAEERLASARSLADIRAVAALAADARHQLDCGRWRLGGPTARALLLRPRARPRGARGRVRAQRRADGARRRLPRAAGRRSTPAALPRLRTVERDGRRFAYWRDPAHIAYFGHEGVKVSDLVVAEERKRQYGDQGMGVFDWLDDWLSPA